MTELAAQGQAVDPAADPGRGVRSAGDAIEADPGGATGLANAASSPDPAVGLRAVVALRKLLETLEVLQVGNARRRGWSWQEIADALGVSKQAVHKKHSGRWPDVKGRE